jgi:hypothetical protein
VHSGFSIPFRLGKKPFEFGFGMPWPAVPFSLGEALLVLNVPFLTVLSRSHANLR